MFPSFVPLVFRMPSSSVDFSGVTTEPPQEPQEPLPDPLGNLYSVATSFLETTLPGWETPTPLPPGAKQYLENLVLLTKSRTGDHIAVQSVNGIWHHGIFVGLRENGPDRYGVPQEFHMVVDVWGPDKASSTISARLFSQFTAGGVAFAKIKYRNGAMPRHVSVSLALHLAAVARTQRFVYDARSNNCEHFATLCRALRWAATLHTHMEAAFIASAIPRAPPPNGGPKFYMGPSFLSCG
jgi:hypothetical protein